LLHRDAILETTIEGHDLAAGSPRVVKLADLLILSFLQYLQDLPRIGSAQVDMPPASVV